MNKNEIRKLLKNKRYNLSKKEILANSKQIKKKLFQIDEYKKAKKILFYVSFNGEVFTHDAIKQSFIDKKVIVPIIKKDNSSLILSELNSFEDLVEGLYGILEPKKEMIKKISIDEIDLIIIPGIGFDQKGNRIGHGEGFYDRLLKNTNVYVVALAYEFQIIEEIPIDNHDIPVDIIITEKRIIKCKN